MDTNKQPISEQSWFIVLAYFVFLFGVASLLQSFLTKKESDALLPEAYCAMEVVYREVDKNNLSENSICMERVLLH